MIHEYALEPELVVTWGDLTLCGHFIDQFGFNRDGEVTGRVVAQYPEDWDRKVRDTLRETPLTPLQKTRVVELLNYIMKKRQPKVVRSYASIFWDPKKSWLENAEEENIRRPFHAILASDNRRENPSVILGNSVWPIDPRNQRPPLWRVSPEKPVPRTATSIAIHLKPMLRCATRILFIDPHFRARPSRWQEPLRRFLEIICDGSREVTLEYHVSACYTKAPPWNEFLDECKQVLPYLIPRNFALTVRRWKDWDVDEELHDRYILTDIGGVAIPKGLSEKAPDTIDILRLSLKIWQKRLKNYGFHYYDGRASSVPKPKPAFDPGDPPETVTISGV